MAERSDEVVLSTLHYLHVKCRTYWKFLAKPIPEWKTRHAVFFLQIISISLKVTTLWIMFSNLYHIFINIFNKYIAYKINNILNNRELTVTDVTSIIKHIFDLAVLIKIKILLLYIF